MKFKKTRKIIQIIPADGWAAVHRNEKHTAYVYTQLACWALLQESDGTINVKGICAEGTNTPPGFDPLWFCDKSDEFTGYVRFKSDGTVYELQIDDDK